MRRCPLSFLTRPHVPCDPLPQLSVYAHPTFWFEATLKPTTPREVLYPSCKLSYPVMIPDIPRNPLKSLNLLGLSVIPNPCSCKLHPAVKTHGPIPILPAPLQPFQETKPPVSRVQREGGGCEHATPSTGRLAGRQAPETYPQPPPLRPPRALTSAG